MGLVTLYTPEGRVSVACNDEPPHPDDVDILFETTDPTQLALIKVWIHTIREATAND